jgi:ligand-binding sensor domain-containing protein
MFKGFSGLFRVHYAGILLTGVLAGNVTGNDLIALTEHNRYYFEAIYRSENFSFGIIEDIQEDRFGFIWIGSKDGLFRYDGTEFIPYFFERSNPESVSSNVIRELFLDSDGALWVGTENGLNKYIDETDNFHRYFFDGDKNHPPAWNIRQIAEKDGELLISTIDGGLVILNKRSEVIERYTKNTTGKAISSNALRTVFIDSEGIIWLGSIDNGVEFMIPGEGNTHRLPVGLQDGNHLHGTNIRSITEATDGTIWIGTNGDGISIYNKQKKSFTYLVHSDTDENSLSSNNVSKIVRDSRGRLWVCTDGGGLNLYNPWEHSFTCFRP